VIVLDPGLLSLINPTEGMKENGTLVLNSKKTPDEIKDEYGFDSRIVAVNANKIALEELGRPIVNTTMLGALLKSTDLLSVEDIEKPLMERFGAKLGPKNMRALKRAFKEAIIKE